MWDEMTAFIYDFGKVMGGLHRAEVKQYFIDRGIGEAEYETVKKILAETSKAFYAEDSASNPTQKL